MPSGDDKELLEHRVAIALTILNNHKTYTTIKDQVDRLFTDTTYKQLAAGVTCETVKSVNESVVTVTDVMLRNKLKRH
ncbi:toxin Cry1Ac domain D-VI-related protein [Enterococcus faecalis]|uniref:toxin Cry1Ac domain D-VI-related protein n=1 Tax=Enterococcus faecalis TaxID=1351 RepID=UPI0023605BF1|nr:toxin Cry1Ac domain D-VI-related protein [Enterococcus faecalis]MDD0851141.1 toxin Cry1Ac domain D-VI-related protein [Enterococcus faecalis]